MSVVGFTPDYLGAVAVAQTVSDVFQGLWCDETFHLKCGNDY